MRKRRRISCSRPRTIESPAVCGRDHSGEDILLQSMERNTPKQISTLQAVEDPGTEQVYPEGLQLREKNHSEAWEKYEEGRVAEWNWIDLILLCYSGQEW